MGSRRDSFDEPPAEFGAYESACRPYSADGKRFCSDSSQIGLMEAYGVSPCERGDIFQEIENQKELEGVSVSVERG